MSGEPFRARFSGASASSWWALMFLIVIGLYMFADRNVIMLQTEPMKASLGLTDFQIGLVQGVSVALFAVTLGYPIAWLADRYGRRVVLAVSVLIWCAAVAAAGLARNFNELFVASALVGAGEAGLLPITYAMIAELFRDRARIIANALITVFGRLASGVIIALSGLLVQNAESFRPWLPMAQDLEAWRLALLVLAIPGPLLALGVFFFKLQGERAGGLGEAQAAGKNSPVWPYLSRHWQTLLPASLGVGMLVFGMSAIGAFLPVVLIRQMGAQPAAVGAGFGTATMIATIVAMIILVTVVARLSKRFGPRYSVWLMVVAALVPAFLTPLFLLLSSPVEIYVLLGIIFTFLGFGAMAFPALLQDLTPQQSRTRLISIAIIINITLSAVAPAVVGAISDLLKALSNGLLVAVVIAGTVSLLISAGLLAASGRHYLSVSAAAREEETHLSEEVVP